MGLKSKFNQSDSYSLYFVADRDRSVGFKDENGDVHWSPKSEIEFDGDDHDRDDKVDVIIPLWLARREGLA